MAEPLAERVVLGTWGISGAHNVGGAPHGYSPVPEACFDDVADAAWEAGIRWIDLAPSYGAGAGIRRLARWQRRRGRNWRAVVKPGRPLHDDGPRSDVSRAGLDAELRDIETFLPRPTGVLIKDPPPEAFGTLPALLSRLAARGYPRVGIATHRHDLARTMGDPPVPDAIIQLEYHLLNRHIAVSTATQLAERGWRVWAMQPLAYGFLGGKHGAATRFPPDDWRSRLPAPIRLTLASAAARLPAWLPAALRDHPLPEVAIAWCLANPAVDRVVIGPRHPDQLQATLRALNLVHLHNRGGSD